MLILSAKENPICVWKGLAKKKQKQKNREEKEKLRCSGMERLKLIIMSASPVPVGRGFRVVGGRGSHMSANGETEWNKGFKMSPVKRQATSLPATDREVSPCGAIVSSLPGGVRPRGERPGEVEEPLLLLIDRLFFLFFFF